MKFADLLSVKGVGVAKDIHYAFFGNVVKGKSALFSLVMRNGFAHFVWRVFARRKLPPGKFWALAPLPQSKKRDKAEQQRFVFFFFKEKLPSARI